MYKDPLCIVIHDFNKYGSACFQFPPEQEEEFRELLARCVGIAKPPLQVVRLTGPDVLNVYSEYKPYTFYDDKQEFLNICIFGNAPGTPWKEMIEEIRRKRNSQ